MSIISTHFNLEDYIENEDSKSPVSIPGRSVRDDGSKGSESDIYIGIDFASGPDRTHIRRVGASAALAIGYGKCACVHDCICPGCSAKILEDTRAGTSVQPERGNTEGAETL